MKIRFVCLLSVALVLINIFPSVKSADGIQNFNSNQEFYGYIINVDSAQNNSVQLNITRLVISLLKDNFQVYWLGSDITIESVNLINTDNPVEKDFSKGSFIVPFTDNTATNSLIKDEVLFYSNDYRLEVYEILTPLTNINVYTLVEPKIAIYGNDVTDLNGYTYPLIDAGIRPFLLNPIHVRLYLNKNNYNIFIWGGLLGPIRTAILETISKSGLKVREAIRNFVESGGTYIGSCYGGWTASSGYKRPKDLPMDQYYCPLLNLLPMRLEIVDSMVYRALPGAGNITIKIVDKDSPLSFGLPEYIDENIYYGGPMFLKKNSESTTQTIGVIHEIDKINWIWDYMHNLWWDNPLLSKETKMNKAENWIEKSIGEAIWITDNFGDGKVITFGTHPEYKNLGYLGRDTPVRIVYNAIFYAVSSDLCSVDIIISS